MKSAIEALFRLRGTGSAVAKLVALAITTAATLDESPDCPCVTCVKLRDAFDSVKS